MIGKVLVFLKNHLNAQLRARLGTPSDDPAGDRVVFVDGDKMDPITFKLGVVSALLINVEEERTLRSADPYTRSSEDGSQYRVQPDIRLNLFVLFVARFKQYEEAWSHLSYIVQYFQTHRVLDGVRAPDLPDLVEKLQLELVTLEFAQQNEVWNALRTTHHPSILYKVRLVVFSDAEAVKPGEVGERVITPRLRQ